MSVLDKLLHGVEVEWKTLGEVADYEQPTQYLVSSKNYDDKYKTPVLTAGKTFILGYTDEINGIYKASENPVIIFDDFTTANKWVDFDFKAKSSAMKMIISRNETKTLLKYIYYWINTLPSGLIEGDHKRQWISTYANLQIPIPPLPIQAEIVRILDTFTELTAELTARKKQYSYYREKLLSFEDGEVEWKTLGELFEFKNGINKEKKFFGTGDAIINYTDVFKNIKLFKENIKGKVEANKSDIERFNCKKGDVFFTRTSETQNEIGYASVLLSDIEICVFSGFLLRARPTTDLLLPEYCAYCFTSDKIRKKIISSSNMTTRVTTTGTILSKIQIPVPSLEEQERIVSILDKFDILTTSISEGLPKEIELRKKQYEYYRDLLLTFPKNNIES